MVQDGLFGEYFYTNVYFDGWKANLEGFNRLYSLGIFMWNFASSFSLFCNVNQ